MDESPTHLDRAQHCISTAFTFQSSIYSSHNFYSCTDILRPKLKRKALLELNADISESFTKYHCAQF